jgi:hypothetical protein
VHIVGFSSNTFDMHGMNIKLFCSYSSSFIAGSALLARSEHLPLLERYSRQKTASSAKHFVSVTTSTQSVAFKCKVGRTPSSSLGILICYRSAG